MIAHEVAPWESISFSGEVHRILVRPANLEEFGQRMATFDMDVTLSGWLVCDVEVSQQTESTYLINILILEQ